MQTFTPEALRLADWIRPEDRVLVGHSTAEPATLLEKFVAERAAYSGARLLMHASFSDIVRPEHADHLNLQGLSAVGAQKRLAASGALQILPVQLFDFVQQVRTGEFSVDVMMLSVSPPDANGRFSLGLVSDYLWESAKMARIVIAEMNAAMPFTCGGPFLTSDDIDLLVPTDCALPEVKPARIDDAARAIAGHVAHFLQDGSVLQLGVGAIPDAVAISLKGFRDLGIHSGVIPDAVMDLMKSGVITNARKPIDTGICVTGAIWGTRELYRFVDGNPAVHLRPSTYTHAPETLARLADLVSLNSAIEIDLTGQANLEVAAGRYIGGVGGALDFVRGARLARNGRSIIALPSTAAGGTKSRIVTNLGGPVTISRSDIDTVVTEFGRAELRGQTLRERGRRLIAIAHPDFREQLEASC